MDIEDVFPEDTIDHVLYQSKCKRTSENEVVSVSLNGFTYLVELFVNEVVTTVYHKGQRYEVAVPRRSYERLCTESRQPR
jgi:hypothetical protein